MKKVNLTKQLIDRAGTPAESKWETIEKTIDPETGVEMEERVRHSRPLTIGAMMENSAINRKNSDETIESVKNNYRLYMLVKDKEEVKLNNEDLNNLKQMICMTYDPFFAGQAMELIDN